MRVPVVPAKSPMPAAAVFPEMMFCAPAEVPPIVTPGCGS